MKTVIKNLNQLDVMNDQKGERQATTKLIRAPNRCGQSPNEVQPSRPRPVAHLEDDGYRIFLMTFVKKEHTKFSSLFLNSLFSKCAFSSSEPEHV